MELRKSMLPNRGSTKLTGGQRRHLWASKARRRSCPKEGSDQCRQGERGGDRDRAWEDEYRNKGGKISDLMIKVDDPVRRLSVRSRPFRVAYSGARDRSDDHDSQTTLVPLTVSILSTTLLL